MGFRTITVLVLTLVLWSSAFAGIRVGLRGFSPGHLALLRFLVASAGFAVYALAARMRLPDRRDLPMLILSGLLGISIYHVALNMGEQTVKAGAASLLVNTQPVFAALLAPVFLGERIKPWGWLGILISFAGAAFIAVGEGGGFHMASGAALILVAAISSAFYTIVQKSLLRRYSALQFTAFAMWTGSAALLVYAPGMVKAISNAPASCIWAVVFLGVFPGALSYLGWAHVMTRLPASRAVSFFYVVPVMAVAVAWVWLGEVPGALTIVGGALALVGVSLVNTLGLVREAAA